MVTYISYAFDSIYYIANTIYIPIPITSNYVYKFTIFQLFIALVITGILIFFFSHLTSFRANLNNKKESGKGDKK